MNDPTKMTNQKPVRNGGVSRASILEWNPIHHRRSSSNIVDSTLCRHKVTTLLISTMSTSVEMTCQRILLSPSRIWIDDVWRIRWFDLEVLAGMAFYKKNVSNLLSYLGSCYTRRKRSFIGLNIGTIWQFLVTSLLPNSGKRLKSMYKLYVAKN